MTIYEITAQLRDLSQFNRGLAGRSGPGEVLTRVQVVDDKAQVILTTADVPEDAKKTFVLGLLANTNTAWVRARAIPAPGPGGLVI